MGSGNYHKDVYLPEYIADQIPKIIHQINYSDHARFKAKQRNILLPRWVCNSELVEVEYIKDRVKKFVIRLRHNLKQDLCLVFSCSRHRMVCVTCWLNACDDKHPTLDVTRYVKDG